ncbi:hypothetical protein FHW69_003172 [Luteibacter sp. Sphag1AF]|uniref:hypothetical protein n=1 Tax=Luteibacter sp. Sphag1AF TaxID=2587031 RepID=UPI0016197564|nr:hypothetical protein [Luteibacter sp. Sphag1AF]MBB3228530.1 hypothetical protein [Luteibacter sp. Sphag1AF]
MNKPAHVFWTATVGLVVFATPYLAMRSASAWHQGYTWAEMDWNRNGVTSPVEFLSASDIGRRRVTSGSVVCTEYYAYKDGDAVRLDCPR